MIGIVDYNMNNLTCVKSSIDYLGFKSKIVKYPKTINEVDKIILPGVGAFGDAIKNLKNKGMIEALHDSVIIKNLFLEFVELNWYVKKATNMDKTLVLVGLIKKLKSLFQKKLSSSSQWLE